MWLKESDLEKRDSSLLKYLHGECHVWVKDNYKTGDKIVVFVDFDEDIGKDCLLHCCLYRGGKYVDVRGETWSMDVVLADFDWFLCERLYCDSIESFNSILKNLGVV